MHRRIQLLCLGPINGGLIQDKQIVLVLTDKVIRNAGIALNCISQII